MRTPRLFLVTTLLCICIYSCNKETENTEPFEETIEMVSLNDEPDLKSTLQHNFNFKTNGRDESLMEIETEFGSLQMNWIYKRISDMQQAAPNYTIKLSPHYRNFKQCRISYTG